MKKALLPGLLLLTVPVAAAQEGMGDPSDWWLLVFTAVILAALALYIYLRVQEAGFFAFLPQTAAKKLDLEER